MTEGMKFDLETLSESFLEELEKIKEIAEGISGYDFSDEDEEESEYTELYGGSKEELKEYQEKFRGYAEQIKDGLEKLYAHSKKEKSKMDKNPEDTSPFERGHKPGCGCPGCSAYERKGRMNMENIHNNQNREIEIDLKMASNSKFSKSNKYVENETDQRPCGGKMYNHFHGDRSGLKNVFGKYTQSFNFGPAGY